MSDVSDEIRSCIDLFTRDLHGLIQKAALDAVQGALHAGASASARGAARTHARAESPRKAPASGASGASGAKKPAAKPVATRLGQKRDPDQLAQLVEKLAAHITSNPGLRIEQINKVLGVPTKELALPIKKLLAAKRISSKGQKRSTAYFPVTGGLAQVRKGKKPAAEPANAE